ncbi:hypothetical protein ES703_112775 [subsurface metagenome]
MAEQNVTLQPGESKVVSFEATPTVAKIYQVSVNGLTGSFVATEALEPVPCVYCGATFSTEAGLISHMESNHPSQPYLIYAYPEKSQVPRGGGCRVNYKAFIPALRALPTGVYSPSWILWITMGTYYSMCIFAYGAWRRVSSGQGFIEGTGTVRAKYNPAPYDVRDIPRGTYPLVSGLGSFHNSGHGPIDQYWWKVDTGQILTVV